MTPSAHRAELVPAYVLHHQPWRDTSRIVELLTADHGRLTVFARGVRAPLSALAGLLQPFTPLLVSWAGRGEAPRLAAAEIAPDSARTPLPPDCILPAYYLNELVMNLTVRHDPQPDLFGHYDTALRALRAGAPLERELRLFEKRLLDVLGYGLDLGPALRDAGEGHYQYRAADGLRPAIADAPDGLPAAALRSLAEERLDDPGSLDVARKVLRGAIAQCLEGRTLKTRRIARSLISHRRPA
jgi:DNA repair protein RecO (recombination protein O)